jgi:hypothetical protein
LKRAIVTADHVAGFHADLEVGALLHFDVHFLRQLIESWINCERGKSHGGERGDEGKFHVAIFAALRRETQSFPQARRSKKNRALRCDLRH